MSYSVAVVGATGAVGREMLRILEQRKFPIAHLVLLASPKSAGKKITFMAQDYPVQAVSPEAFNFQSSFFHIRRIDVPAQSTSVGRRARSTEASPD